MEKNIPDKKKIVWLDINSSYSHSSLALPAIESSCKRTDVQWDVVGGVVGTDYAIVVRKVLSLKPDIIAATAWLFTHDYLVRLIARIKAVSPDIIVVLGGPEFLGDNRNFLLQHPFITAVCRGEGEEVFHQWLDRLSDPMRWKEVKGFCFFTQEGQYIDTGVARIDDFAALPSPLFSRFFPREKPFVQLETARGCFNSCGFCVSGNDKPLRTLSLSEVRRRLDTIVSYGIGEVRVLDRTFNGNPRRAGELMELFAEYHGKLRFHLEVHPALLGHDIREYLKKAPDGLLHLEAGIQSLRSDVLQRCSRNGSLTDSLDGLRFLSSLENLETHADLIAGLPGYSLQMIIEDVKTLCAIGVAEIQLELLKLLPGTSMRDQSDALSLCYAPYPPYEVLRSDAMTPADLRSASEISKMLDFYYNTPQWRGVFSLLLLQYNNFFDDFFTCLCEKGILEQPASMEKRGLLLYEFCMLKHPEKLEIVSIAWIEAGLSLNKKPCDRLHSCKMLPTGNLHIIYGTHTPSMRMYALKSEQGTHLFGYDRGQCHSKPLFRAFVDNHSARLP